MNSVQLKAIASRGQSNRSSMTQIEVRTLQLDTTKRDGEEIKTSSEEEEDDDDDDEEEMEEESEEEEEGEGEENSNGGADDISSQVDFVVQNDTRSSAVQLPLQQQQ